MAAGSEDTMELLHHVPVFAELAEDDLARVAEVAVPRRFESGEVVFREGDESNTCYVVRTGQARAVREHTDGRSITLANFGPGRHLRRAGDVRRRASLGDRRDARGDRGDRDPRRRHAAAAREHPAIAIKLLASLGRRLRETNERLARQSFQTVQSRVAAVLSQLVAAAQAEGAGDGDVLITSTQASLAQLAGLLTRIGQPVPRGARAGRDNHPGPRQADRARSGGPRPLRLLVGRPRTIR